MLKHGAAGILLTILICIALEQDAAYADGGFGAVTCTTIGKSCDLWAGTRGPRDNPKPIPRPRSSSSSASDSVSCPSLGAAALACLDTMDGWSGSDGCRYQTATDFVASPAVQAVEAIPGEAGSWYWKWCGGEDFGVVWLPDAGAARGVQSPAVVAQLAVKKLVVPAPRWEMSPAAGVPQMVGVPVWLWLAGGWGPVSATAAVPGVSVTATARPQGVTWDFGDGGVVSCVGPGTPFRLGVDDPAAGSPDCGVVFTHSSAGQVDGRFPVSVTVRWLVGWAGAGQQGVVPGLTSRAVSSVVVSESQALVVAGSGGVR